MLTIVFAAVVMSPLYGLYYSSQIIEALFGKEGNRPIAQWNRIENP